MDLSFNFSEMFTTWSYGMDALMNFVVKPLFDSNPYCFIFFVVAFTVLILRKLF